MTDWQRINQCIETLRLPRVRGTLSAQGDSNPSGSSRRAEPFSGSAYSEQSGLQALRLRSGLKSPDLQSDVLYLCRGAEVFESAIRAVGAAGDTYCPAMVD